MVHDDDQVYVYIKVLAHRFCGRGLLRWSWLREHRRSGLGRLGLRRQFISHPRSGAHLQSDNSTFGVDQC